MSDLHIPKELAPDGSILAALSGHDLVSRVDVHTSRRYLGLSPPLPGNRHRVFFQETARPWTPGQLWEIFRAHYDSYARGAKLGRYMCRSLILDLVGIRHELASSVPPSPVPAGTGWDAEQVQVYCTVVQDAMDLGMRDGRSIMAARLRAAMQETPNLDGLDRETADGIFGPPSLGEIRSRVEALRSFDLWPKTSAEGAKQLIASAASDLEYLLSLVESERNPAPPGR